MALAAGMTIPADVLPNLSWKGTSSKGTGHLALNVEIGHKIASPHHKGLPSPTTQPCPVLPWAPHNSCFPARHGENFPAPEESPSCPVSLGKESWGGRRTGTLRASHSVVRVVAVTPVSNSLTGSASSQTYLQRAQSLPPAREVHPLSPCQHHPPWQQRFGPYQDCERARVQSRAPEEEDAAWLQWWEMK